MNAPAPALRRAADSLSTRLHGWFCVGLSHELKAGEVRAVRLFGEDRVLFRTASGRAVLLDAHCPHLGAHLGHGGQVVGERLLCPFHRFEFDVDGHCAGTACNSRAPRGSSVHKHILEDIGGLLLVWVDPLRRAPLFDLPDWELDHHSPIRGGCTRVATHPQETSENSVDLSHFDHIHGYTDVEVARPAEVDGPHLSVTYRMRRPTPGLPPQLAVPAEFEVNVWGLGLSIVTIRVPPLQVRLFVLATPTEPGHIDLRAATQVRLGPRLSRSRAAGLSARLLNRLVLHGVLHDVEQDRRMWEHKRYEPVPRVVRGDGAIGRYRQYVRQFYVSE